MIMNKMNIEPITIVRDTANLEERVKKAGGCLVLTKNGKASLLLLEAKNDDQGKFDEENAYFQPSKNDEKIDECGFVRVRAKTPVLYLGNAEKNREEIKAAIEEAKKDKVDILLFPELALTGYTLGDKLLDAHYAEESLKAILSLKDLAPEMLIAIGAPFYHENRLYNAAYILNEGKIKGIVPKTFLPDYGEFYEGRWFSSATDENALVYLEDGSSTLFGKRIIFSSLANDLRIGVEICEDLWALDPPSTALAKAGANLILNLSASNEVVGKKEYRRSLVSSTSARLLCAYAYCSSGINESTTDLVFGGHNLIAENGKILGESLPFKEGVVTVDLDFEKLKEERLSNSSFRFSREKMQKVAISFRSNQKETILRKYRQNPFIPSDNSVDTALVSDIMNMQVYGLKKRLEATGLHSSILGLSGGLDSTLALLVLVETYKVLKRPLKEIMAIALPAFGTSSRTLNNAEKLANVLGVSYEVIDIKKTLESHFYDIKHPENLHDVTYENAQARERTQVLMDVANAKGALMIGTGDLSELCLGWTTYGGDHMSMYGVNSSIPKTLVKYLVEGYAIMHPETRDVLLDILGTPISPELVPPDKNGQIVQKTEEALGPYLFHDFLIYHFLRFHFHPKKLLRIAKQAFMGIYSEEEMKRWLGIFFKRFFSNQFKRSCLPDGVKVGTVAISPRGDLRLPSDLSPEIYMQEIEKL